MITCLAALAEALAANSADCKQTVLSLQFILAAIQDVNNNLESYIRLGS